MIVLEGRLLAGLDEFMLRLGHLSSLCAVAAEVRGSWSRVERELAGALTADVVVPDDLPKIVDVARQSANRQQLHSVNLIPQESPHPGINANDLPEILAICERVIVMHEGRVTGELNASELSEAKVMYYATDVQVAEKGA